MCFWCGATGRTEEYVSDDELYEEDIQRSSTPPSCESAMSGFILTALGGYKLLLRQSPEKSLGRLSRLVPLTWHSGFKIFEDLPHDVVQVYSIQLSYL